MLDNKTKGALALITSSLSFAVMGMMVKLTGGGIPLMEQVFFRNLVMVFISAYWIRKSGVRFFGHPENRGLLLLRSTSGFVGVLTNFYATNHLYFADAQALLKLSPFAVTLLAVVFLKERLSRIRILALISSFVGALIIINPSFNAQLFPAMIALLSAFSAGLSYVLISYISRKENKESGLTIIFLFSLFSTVLALPLMMPSFVTPSPIQLLMLLMIGIFAAGGQYFVTLAYSLTDASEISVFDYTGVIFAAVIGLLMFKETLGLTSYIGMVVIIFSGILSYLDAKHMLERQKYR